MKKQTLLKIIFILTCLFLCSYGKSQETIFLDMDSLTEGAGGTSYRNYFCQDSLTESLGYIPIDFKSTENVGISVFMTENMKWFSPSIKYNVYPKKFSLDGKGIYSDKANNDKCGFNIQRIKDYNSIGLYYLKQPKGGSFKFLVSFKGAKTDSLEVNTISKKEEIGYVKISSNNSDRVFIENISGKVVFFGLYFNPQQNTSIVNTFAKGGVKLNDIMSLDSSFRIEWFKILNPSAYIFNAGMNDRNTVIPDVFKKNLENFILDLNKGVPNCKVILVEPNEPHDFNETFLPEYRKIREEISKKHQNVFYYSIPESIGNFQYFVNNNLMLDDVHPNDKANKAMGKGLYSFYNNLKN